MCVQPVDGDDPPEEEMVTHCGIFAWEIPWTLAGHSPWGQKESDTTGQAFTSRFILI